MLKISKRKTFFLGMMARCKVRQFFLKLTAVKEKGQHVSFPGFIKQPAL